MDHIKIFSSFVSLLLALFALFLIINLSKQKRSPLSRFVLLLVITHIVYECYAFGFYYVDVNILKVHQSTTFLTFKIVWLVMAIILLLFRVLLIKISAILLEKELPFRLWRWLGVIVAGLIIFLAAWIASPSLHAQFYRATTAFRISLAVIELVTMIIVLLGSRSRPGHHQRSLLRSFALLHLLELVFFVFRWTIYRNPGDLLLPRLVTECFYPIYFNIILPVWLWFFYRPWLAYSTSQKTISGLTGNLDGLGLSGREQEILNMILLGKGNHDIAEKIFVSEHTVKNTITSIYAKLGVSNRKELFHRFLSGNVKPGQ